MTGPTPPSMTPAEWVRLSRELPVTHWLQPRVTAWLEHRALWVADGEAKRLGESWGDTTDTTETRMQ